MYESDIAMGVDAGMEETLIQCKTCDQGKLVSKKKYRMGGMVVFIGYILLIPSFLGVLLSSFFLIAAIFSASATNVDTGTVTAIFGGVSIFILISSIVGGLLGWLLVMKKRVLQCSFCGAIIPVT